MPGIKKRYVVDEDNQPVAVLIDLATFRRIEALLEDLALAARIGEAAREPPLTVAEARKRYAKRKKAE
jgi:hypothetical protein